VARAGGCGLVVFVAARHEAPVKDRARTTDSRGSGELLPGDGGATDLPAARRAALIRALKVGNVVMVYGPPAPPRDLTALARDIAGGPYDPALEQAGQAVILARQPATQGVVALAWGHRLRAASASDPALRAFADTWLGRGAAG
jgi:hypothetical protein